MTNRTCNIERRTHETSIEMQLTLDGTGQAQIATGIGFLDHLLAALVKHARWNVTLSCVGDLHVDDHHTAEDCALVLGAGVDKALGDRAGIRRFGYAYAPLDESLARAVIDFSGRPYADVNLALQRDSIGGLACENVGHVLSSFATAARATVHVDVLKGRNDHHRAEAAFKALALALRDGVSPSGFGDVASTKGTLTGGAE